MGERSDHAVSFVQVAPNLFARAVEGVGGAPQLPGTLFGEGGALLRRRAAAGLRDEAGREASPVPAGIDKDEYGARVRAKLGGRTEIPPPSGYQVFAPTIDTFLKEHLFCDIFIRDNLTHKQRELATIGALGAMTGTAGQLNFHLGAALNTGTTPEEMRDYLVEIERAAGAGQTELARGALENILAKRRPS